MTTTQRYTVLDSRWWTGCMTLIGAVAVQTAENEWKAFIGTADGYDQQGDEQWIATWGAGLQPEEAQVFFPRLDINQYKPY